MAESTSAPFDLSNPNRTIHAGVILTKGETELLDVAVLEFFVWTDPASLKLLNFPPEWVAAGLDVQMHWVTEDGEPAPLRSRGKMTPTDSFATAPPLDIAVLGAHKIGYTLSPGEKAYITQTYSTCSAFLSVCGGILTLMDAISPAELAGKRVTVTRPILAQLRKNASHIQWQDKRWEQDGKLWSSSTLMNGGDLVRAFVERIWKKGTPRGEMVRAVLDMGHWPDRDVDFKDFTGTGFDISEF